MDVAAVVGSGDERAHLEQYEGTVAITGTAQRRRPGALEVAGAVVAVVLLTYLVFGVGLLFTRNEGAAVLAALVVAGAAAALRGAVHQRYVITILVAGTVTALGAGVLFEFLLLPEDF